MSGDGSIDIAIHKSAGPELDVEYAKSLLLVSVPQSLPKYIIWMLSSSSTHLPRHGTAVLKVKASS